MARTDRSMLVALSNPDISDKLTEDERNAFTDMLGRMESGSSPKLSPKQRLWAERIYLKLHLDAEEPSENLVSSGRVRRPKPEEGPVKVFPFETMHRPLKPPGRV